MCKRCTSRVEAAAHPPDGPLLAWRASKGVGFGRSSSWSGDSRPSGCKSPERAACPRESPAG
eukprot:12026056-Alexandrium_andersonii.AAC.1